MGRKKNAIGIYVKLGKYGGTFAHKDIALEFCSAVNPIFKLFLIKEFQRLKVEENNKDKLEWSLQRTISKINYRIHTDAIKENLIPISLKAKQKNYMYADEADILNIALFSKTSKEWRYENPNEKGNIRDIASIEQLVVLFNLESINAILIQQEMLQQDRLMKLNEIAISQMKSLINTNALN